MPLATTDAGTLIVFGCGDVHYGLIGEPTGEGLVYFGNGPAGECGRVSEIPPGKFSVEVLMRFTTVESLSTFIADLTRLRVVMTERTTN